VSSRGWSHIPATYDVVAADYAAAFSDELDDQPFDRELLDGLARDVAGRGLVCDLGCGPGQIGGYLAQRGCDVVGIDISPGMLRSARDRHGDVQFQLGDMRALPLAEASCVAIACFYALIHIPRDEVPVALAEIGRVLRPDGALVLAVHGGAGELQHGEHSPVVRFRDRKPELAEDVGHVLLHRPLAHHQRRADTRIGTALGHQVEDVLLP
jgi:SAM-dependent methyltransferase